MEKPWVTGPRELLRHGLEHMRLGTDFDKRLAMISIDNAVELMIKTYLGLPSRITGVRIGRRRLQKMSETFPDLLDALEEHAGDKIAGTGISLNSIQFFHQLRNRLYHDGNGITVEEQKLESYAEIAVMLFGSLFDVRVEDMERVVQSSAVGEIVRKWAVLEQTLKKLVESRVPGYSQDARTPIASTAILSWADELPPNIATQVQELYRFRNDLLHGQATLPTQEVKKRLSQLNALLHKVEKV